MKRKDITLHDIVHEALTIAFVQLLSQRPYESIAVSDIVRRAGVSRSSFYRILGPKNLWYWNICKANIVVFSQ